MTENKLRASKELVQFFARFLCVNNATTKKNTQVEGARDRSNARKDTATSNYTQSSS